MHPTGTITGPLRTLLVDDEPLARQRMRMLLARHADVEVLGECADGPEAVLAIDALAPDLVFLDVEMPTLDGFGVLRHLPEEQLPSVVFVSGHDQYAVKAFETHAVDYLLKPVAADRVDRTLERVRARRAAAAGGAAPREEAALRALAAQLRADEREAIVRAEPRATGRLAIRTAGQLLLLQAAEIDWVEAEGNYVRVHARGTSWVMRETMKHMEHRLDPQQFVRIHRGAIVNLDSIARLEPWPHGEYIVWLKGDVRLTASRVYVGRLRNLLAG